MHSPYYCRGIRKKVGRKRVSQRPWRSAFCCTYLPRLLMLKVGTFQKSQIHIIFKIDTRHQNIHGTSTGQYKLGNSPQRCPSQMVYAKIQLLQYCIKNIHSFLYVLNFTVLLLNLNVFLIVLHFLKLIPIPKLFQGTLLVILIFLILIFLHTDLVTQK